MAPQLGVARRNATRHPDPPRDADAAEAAEALAEELFSRSFPVVRLAGPSGSGSYLDDADLDRWATEVLALASGSTPSPSAR